MSTDELVKLRQAADDAQRVYQAIGATNTVGKTAEEKVNLDLAYRRAYRKWWEAVSQYQRALDTVEPTK